MMIRAQSRRPSIPLPVVLGLAVVGLAIVARVSPESSTLGRMAREVEAAAVRLPETLQQMKREARERLAQATTAFQVARSQTERALTSQLQEAKERGSLPPV
jgi:hypothetical protein